jgi:hypothetical protein
MLILFRDLLSNEKIRQSPIAQLISQQNQLQFAHLFNSDLEFGECTLKYLPTSQAVSN